MKEPLDELLVQACAAQQRADLAALEQLEPANVPMPFVPQVRRTPRRLLKIVIIAAVCAVTGNNRLCLLAKSCRDPGGQSGHTLPCRKRRRPTSPWNKCQLTWLAGMAAP